MLCDQPNRTRIPPDPCGGSGVCQRCNGEGTHPDETCDWVECEICLGSGECPCIWDCRAHASPVAGEA